MTRAAMPSPAPAAGGAGAMPGGAMPAAAYPAPGDLDPLTALVSMAKQLYRNRWPHVERFEQNVWESHPHRTVREKTPNHVLRFHGMLTDRWCAAPFADALRAFLVLEDQRPETAVGAFAGPRYLWDAICERMQDDAVEFRWTDLRVQDCERMVALMQEAGLARWSIYGHTQRCERFLRWAEDNGVRRVPIEWRNPLTDPKVESQRTHEGRIHRLSRLPSRDALAGLARIYREATAPPDRLLVCAMGLLLLTGFRLDELLTLRADALFSEARDERTVWGIRYYNKKTRGKTKKYAVRWLSPLGALLAQSLFEEALSLTADARERARVLEEADPLVPIPGFEDAVEISAGDLATALGTSLSYVRSMRSPLRKVVTPLRRSRPGKGQFNLVYFRTSDLQPWLQAQRLPLDIDLGHGDRERLSDLLFVAPFHFFPSGEAVNPLPPRTLFVEPLYKRRVNVFLAGQRGGTRKERKGAPTQRKLSAFERFHVTEPDGHGGLRVCTMKSHMLRHWLNTLAHKSGMSAFHITMWMQRSDPTQTALYLHDAADLAELTREKILLNEMWGTRVHEVEQLPEEERREHLERTLTSAHAMEEGICTANFHIDSCEVEKACAANCRFYVRTPGSTRERAALLAQREALCLQQRQLDAAVAAGRVVAPGQRQFIARYLAGIDAALAIDPPEPPTTN